MRTSYFSVSLVIMWVLYNCYIILVVVVSYESKLFGISLIFGNCTALTHPMYISCSDVSQVKQGPQSAKLNKPLHMVREISCDYNSVVWDPQPNPTPNQCIKKNLCNLIMKKNWIPTWAYLLENWFLWSFENVFTILPLQKCWATLRWLQTHPALSAFQFFQSGGKPSLVVPFSYKLQTNY